jgi:hypothetical protein
MGEEQVVGGRGWVIGVGVVWAAHAYGLLRRPISEPRTLGCWFCMRSPATYA